MNAKVIRYSWLLALSLTGCAAWWYSPTPVFPDNSPRPMVEPQTSPTEAELLSRAVAQPIAPFAGDGWRDLFDGRTMAGWQQTKFDEGGRVSVRDGLLVFEQGKPFVGVNGTNDMPVMNYELAFDAMRVAGNDFFCGLTFPVNESHCSLIVGGWGGGLVGISSVDGYDASENETTKYVSIETGRWYRIRLRVTEQRIEAWIELKKVVDLVITGRKLDVRFGEIMLSRPFGLCSWDTSAAYRAIKIRPVSGPEDTR